MSKLKMGVIGVGSMGKNHVRSYAALKHLCDLVGVFDLDSERNKAVAESYGVKAFDSVDSLMKEVDAINIATPTTTHYELAMKAIDTGLHILIEKPITNSVEEAQAILKAAKKKNLIVQVGHIERFNPAIQALPDILKDEKIVALHVERMGPYDPRIDDTDVIQDLMIHDIDVVSSLVPGDITNVSAAARRVESERHMDYAVANFRLANGAIATLTASRATRKKVRSMSITTTNSYIELDYLQRKIVVTGRKEMMADSSEYKRNNEHEENYSNDEEPLKSQLAHFINCINNGTRPLINGSDGLEALKLTKVIQHQVYNRKNQINIARTK
ncbi:MAG: Gfo/Idh/MocA family oxidoreductase [Halarsenatibacteraceae bacterium]